MTDKTVVRAQDLQRQPPLVRGELALMRLDGAGNLANLAQGDLRFEQNAPWAVTWSGQTVVATQGGAWSVSVTGALPTGANVIGGVTQSGGPWSVTWSGQSVTLAGALPDTADNALAATAAALGTREDGVYSGTGAASVVSAIKGVYRHLSGTLSVSWAGQSVGIEAGSNTIGRVDVNRPGNIATARVSVGGNPTPIVAARKHRATVRLRNAGTVSVYIGQAGVTPKNGSELLAGEALPLDTTAAIYGVAASGSARVDVLELY